MWWEYGVALLYSAIVGHFAIARLSDALWQRIADGTSDVGAVRVHLVIPQMVGVLERALYTASWLLGKPEFIGVWLVLKVAGQWKSWSDDPEVGGKRINARAIFNLFLIGNGFSIAFGVVGALEFNWLSNEHFLTAAAVAIGLVLGCLLFTEWSKRAAA